MAEIPQELITEIFEFLPVKTLLRFRCLSKSLCAIIDCPDFINSHLRKTSDNKTHRKIIIQDATQRYPEISPIHVLDIDDNYTPFPHPKTSKQFLNSDFSHSNGLVLFQAGYDYSNLTVWNPSTQKTRKLSVLPTEPPPDRLCLSSTVSGLGIGYDSSADDYKILLIRARNIIIAEWPCGDFNAEDQYDIWISGLRSLSWRKIADIPDDIGLGIADYRNCFIDNAFHFLRYNHISAFDVAKERFSRLSLPNFEDTRARGSCPCDLQIVEGCLSVSYSSLKKEGKIDLYIRKNDGGGEFYWTKLFSVTNKQLSCITLGSEISYLGFPNINGGDGIFVLGDKYVLCSYDFKERLMKRIVVGDRYKQKITFCIESLVSVDFPTEE